MQLLKCIKPQGPAAQQYVIIFTCMAMRTSGSLNSSFSPGIPNGGAPPGKPAPPEGSEQMSTSIHRFSNDVTEPFSA